MTELTKEKQKFIEEIQVQIQEGNRLHDLYPIEFNTAATYSFDQVDKLNRELKTYDSYNKELIKQSFNSTISENDYLIEYSKIIHMNDGLIGIPVGPNPNYAAMELFKSQVVLRNIVEFFQDLLSKIDLIQESSNLKTKIPKEEYIILMLASNPDDQDALNFPREFREITELVKRSPEGYRIKFETRMAVRSKDILMAINETKPDFIHFSGHGEKKALTIQTSDELTQDLDLDTLTSILSSCEKPIKLLLLSACESSDMAKESTKIVDYSVGMNDEIGDEAATAFAAQFYSSLAFGNTVSLSFTQGITAIRLEGLTDFNIPELHHNNKDPENECLIKSSI